MRSFVRGPSGRRRLPLVFAGVAVVASSIWLGPGARAQQPPVRSGRIISGVLTTSPSWECRLVPDCLAWLASDCDPALAGRDPAWLASIVDVGAMADGVTRRTFWYGEAWPAGFVPGGMTVELWTAGCRKLDGHRFWKSPPRQFGLIIPASARWMTVTANDKVNATWTLS